MAVFHCKMCGGEIELHPDASAARCGHCGTQQTLPKLDTQRRENLYDCVGHFLRCGDFDKADAVCRRILSEEPADPEAHWLLALCRYGVVYEEDTVLYRRVPVLRRTRLTPFPDDPDYGAALQFADAGRRPLYESAAKAIHEAQEKILAAAQREAPFDVYLCCMETDASGRRTQDPVLANNLYQQLSREGLRVFFEHVTLSDRLAGNFEPYRFAALNSAPAMIVLGTRPEHFRDLQVKDVWGRFLALMENGAPKRLLPVYRDMDRYALPGAFSPLRAWDMNEIDFAQELIRELGAPLPPPAASAVPPADKNAAAGQAAFASEPMEQTAFAPDPVREAASRRTIFRSPGSRSRRCC